MDVAFSVRSSTESSPVSESFYVVPKVGVVEMEHSSFRWII